MVFFTLFECCLRLLRYAPESSFDITLPPLRPYSETGSLARSLPDEISVSAGVSRKRVHLFRWRSYFQKAFTGAKKTTSRERLPNPSLRRRTFTTQPPGLGVSRITGLHRQSLTNHRSYFLIFPPGPCASGGPETAARHQQMIARRRPASLRRQHASRDHLTGTHSQAVMASVRPSRPYATPHHWRNKEYDYGPTHCRPPGY